MDTNEERGKTIARAITSKGPGRGENALEVSYRLRITCYALITLRPKKDNSVDKRVIRLLFVDQKVTVRLSPKGARADHKQRLDPLLKDTSVTTTDTHDTPSCPRVRGRELIWTEQKRQIERTGKEQKRNM